jgi:hypothetical protein
LAARAAAPDGAAPSRIPLIRQSAIAQFRNVLAFVTLERFQDIDLDHGIVVHDSARK